MVSGRGNLIILWDSLGHRKFSKKYMKLLISNIGIYSTGCVPLEIQPLKG